MRLSQMISVRLRHTNRLLKEARDAVKVAELANKEQSEKEAEEGGATERSSEDPAVEPDHQQ